MLAGLQRRARSASAPLYARAKNGVGARSGGWSTGPSAPAGIPCRPRHSSGSTSRLRSSAKKPARRASVSHTAAPGLHPHRICTYLRALALCADHEPRRVCVLSALADVPDVFDDMTCLCGLPGCHFHPDPPRAGMVRAPSWGTAQEHLVPGGTLAPYADAEGRVVANGRIEPGTNIVLAIFGVGFPWGSALLIV